MGSAGDLPGSFSVMTGLGRGRFHLVPRRVHVLPGRDPCGFLGHQGRRVKPGLMCHMPRVVTGVGCILGLSGAWYVLLFYGGTGFSLCTLHAIFRPRTLRSKANRLAKDVKAGGGFSIEVRVSLSTRALAFDGGGPDRDGRPR